jgi:hypothetical protein
VKSWRGGLLVSVVSSIVYAGWYWRSTGAGVDGLPAARVAVLT